MGSRFVPLWFTPATAKAAVITAGVLFVVSYAVDLGLASAGVSPASTILNDLAIALIGTVVVVYYLFAIQTQNVVLRAKERMNLTAELNHHLRRAMIQCRAAAELDDRMERIQALDQVMEDVDHLLINLVPTVSGDSAPRFDSRRSH
jgi:hypothetical protein